MVNSRTLAGHGRERGGGFCALKLEDVAPELKWAYMHRSIWGGVNHAEFAPPRVGSAATRSRLLNSALHVETRNSIQG